MRYYDIPESLLGFVLGSFIHFNPNKETAYINREDVMYKWDSSEKLEQIMDESVLNADCVFLCKSVPDPTPSILGHDAESGVCYSIKNVSSNLLHTPEILSVFSNPHASTLSEL